MRRQVTRTTAVRQHREQRYSTKNWLNRLEGVPCFILGNSPSILDHDIQSLSDYMTIGINRIFRLIDPIMLFWQDIGLWKTESKAIHNLQALKVSRDVSDPRRLYYNFHLKGGFYEFDRTKSHIFYGRGSTGPIAVQMAVALGCSPLILLGMDCKLGKDGATDFYGVNNFHLPHTLEFCRTGLQFLKDHCPVPIKFCGNSDLWERRELSDVLKEISPKFAMGRKYYSSKILGTTS